MLKVINVKGIYSEGENNGTLHFLECQQKIVYLIQNQNIG